MRLDEADRFTLNLSAVDSIRVGHTSTAKKVVFCILFGAAMDGFLWVTKSS
jgi:hypothetical protein